MGVNRFPSPNESPEQIQQTAPKSNTSKVVSRVRTEAAQQSIDSSSRLPAPGLENSASDLLRAGESSISTIFNEADVWKLQISLNNYSVDPFVVSDHQLVEVTMNHNITEPSYLKGYVTISSSRIGDVVYNDELNTEFVFRGDGKDELSIDLKPGYGADVLPPEIWFTELDFIVYDVEDLPAGKQHYKRVHFWHKPFYIMHTRSINFSTADFIEGNNIDRLNNEDRKIFTGDAIRHCLEVAGLEEYIDKDNWDQGSSKIFYTVSTNTKVEDIIQYLLSNHTSSEGSHSCVLYYNRGINKFQLIPIPTFFDKAGVGADSPGEYQIEHFWILAADTGEDDIPPRVSFAPNDQRPDAYDRDIKIQHFSTIDENAFTLSDMSGSDSMLAIVNRPVHTYDHGRKRFITKIVDNLAENTKQYFTETYSSKLFPGERGAPLFVLNQDKTQNRVNHHCYVPFNNKTDAILTNYGRNFIAKSAVFLNLGISFSCPGGSHRHPGRFIAIERNAKNDTKYDYKLLGQWFVTGTTFQWYRGVLTSHIQGVKVNTYGDLKFSEDV